MPDSVEEMCSEVPRLDRLLKDINDISESGARYTEMPQVRRAWTVVITTSVHITRELFI
jgi:hypothetical protein